MSEQVVLAGVDGEHLRAAHDDGLGEPGRLASFGTDWWSELSDERIEAFPRHVPIYFYVVTRGLEESVPYAQWEGEFVRYQPGPLSPEEWGRTRPSTTRSRRDPSLPLNEQETEWAGYLMVAGLHELVEPVALGRFRVGGRRFEGTVVRHPMLVELP